jgi:hypothetical protein
MDIDSIYVIFLFIQDIKSFCNFEMTNKMMYIESNSKRSGYHKKYLKHFYNLNKYKQFYHNGYNPHFLDKHSTEINITYDNINLNYSETIELHNFEDLGNKIVFNLPHTENSFFKNLRFADESIYSKIKSCTLIIGGQPIDKIDANMFDCMRHLYNIDNDAIIPFHFCKKNKYLLTARYHEIKIHMLASDEYNKLIDNIILKIDIFNICEETNINNLTSSPYSASYEQVVNVQSTLIFLRKTD